MIVEERLRLLDSAMDNLKTRTYAVALEKFRFLEAESENPRDIAALRLFQAGCLTDLGNADQAVAVIRSVDSRDLDFSNRVVLEFESARIERATGDHAEALRISTKGLQLVSNAEDKEAIAVVASNLRTLSGILLAELGHCAQAIPMLTQVPKEDEGWAEAKIHLGDCFVEQRRYHDAISAYESVILQGRDVNPVLFHDAMRNAGCALYYLGRYTESLTYLLRVRDKYANYPSLDKELQDTINSVYLKLGKAEATKGHRETGGGSYSIH